MSHFLVNNGQFWPIFSSIFWSIFGPYLKNFLDISKKKFSISKQFFDVFKTIFERKTLQNQPKEKIILHLHWYKDKNTCVFGNTCEHISPLCSKMMTFWLSFVIKTNFFIFQSAKHEESLSVELQSLKDQVNLKRSSMNEHVSHLESLREEVSYFFLQSCKIIFATLCFYEAKCWISEANFEALILTSSKMNMFKWKDILSCLFS